MDVAYGVPANLSENERERDIVPGLCCLESIAGGRDARLGERRGEESKKEGGGGGNQVCL